MSGGVNDWLAGGIIDGKGNNEISVLGDKKMSPSGEMEGGEGRLVTLTVPIEMQELEKRVKRHLNLSCSQ